MVCEYLAGEHVWFDTAFTFDYISQEMFLKIWEKHDHEKMLFATDSPWSDAKRAVAVAKSLPIEEEAVDAILCKNARNLLQI